MTAHLLELEDVQTQIALRRGAIRAVDHVSLTLDPGETLGIVGESGSGKSMTALSIMRLLPRAARITGGRIRFKGRDLADLSEDEMEAIRGTEMAMIFQDPMTSLNPVYRAGWQVGEPLRIHRHVDKRASIAAAVDLFRKVGIPDAKTRVGQFPHQFSGGMRQRTMIAMGLSTGPSLLIADEPTTALDVTIQAQILDLLRALNRDYGTATILITHNLGVVAGMCDRVLVMYAGRVVEQGTTEDVFVHPEHPYTWSLLRSIPRLDATGHEPLRPIEGSPPDMGRLPAGCKFHPRCPFVIDRCREEEPDLREVRSQLARCWVTQAGRSLDSPDGR
ncbi:MAG: ABC transporter ATP-binding protein [Chloroflexi bacterium]|nr:MAG: ABC transporter ATP-binding protein [Chloroflexota bacterium]